MIVLKATQGQILNVLHSVAGIVERRHALPILASVLIEQDDPQIVRLGPVLLHAPQKRLTPVLSASYGLLSLLIGGKGRVGLSHREEGTRHWQVISDSGPK